MASRWENLAQELAIAFHLDDDEFEAIKGRRTGREGRELIIEIGEYPRYPDLVPGLSKFCALHLPRFIAAYSELLPKSLATFWTSLLVTFSTNPLFTRWVRQEDGMGLIATLGEGCCAIESSFDFNTSPFSAQPFGHARMIEALMQICLNTAMALPPPPNSSTKPHPFPPGLHSRLASALRRQGIAMVDFEDRYPQQIRQSQRRDLDRTTRGLYAFGTFVDAKTADAWRKDWTGREGPVRWWACEGRSGRELRECVKLKEGGEMMACGRCNSVRYCCQDHQRAHWKLHKPYCHKPSW